MQREFSEEKKLELEFPLTQTERGNGKPYENRRLLSVMDSSCDAYVYTDVCHRALFFCYNLFIG